MRHLLLIFAVIALLGCDEEKRSSAMMPDIPYEVCCNNQDYAQKRCFFCFSEENIDHWAKKKYGSNFEWERN